MDMPPTPDPAPGRRSARRRGAPLLGAVVLAGAAWAPGAHAAGWSAARTVTPAGFYVTDFAVAGNASGSRSAVLYAGLERYRSSRRHGPGRIAARLGRGSRLGRTQLLDRARGSTAPARLAVGPDGTAVAAWQRLTPGGRQLIRAAIAPPRRSFGRPQTLVATRSTAALGDVVVGLRGRAVVTWSSQLRGGRVARAALRPPGRRFAIEQTLGATTSPPALAVTRSGLIAAAWAGTVEAGVGPLRAIAAVLPIRARRFAASVALPGELSRFGSVLAVSGAAGAAIAYDGGANASGHGIDGMRVARVGRVGFLVPLPLAAPAPSQPPPSAVAVVAGGDVAAVWRVEPAASGAPDARATLVTTSTAPAAAPLLSARVGPGLSGDPAAAAVRDALLAAWSEKTGSGAARVRVAEARGGRASFGPAVTVAAGRAIQRVTLVAAGRRAQLAWMHRDGPFPGELRVAHRR